MKLNVFVDGEKVGILDRVSREDNALFYRFRYLEGVSPQNQVSLTMPVQPEPYLLRKMPSCFDMLLPEGDRREAITKLSKLTHITDLKLLAIVGSNTIGRIQLSTGEILSEPVHFDSKEVSLCEDSEALFDALLSEHGFKSGVSGVQPKVLTLDPYNFSGDEEAVESEARTIICSTEIVKHTSHEFPCLILNEYVCLKAAKKAGLTVPRSRISKDGDLLAIKRFDIDVDKGRHFGFEEMASLKGLVAEQKYQGSFDLICLEIEERVSGEHMLDDLEDLFRQLTFNILIRNGDTHMKNFGLLYDNDDVRLSPAYDLVTTVVYEPRDMPALCLSHDNYTKRWWSKEELFDFGQDYCYLSTKKMNEIVEETASALVESCELIDSLIETHPHFEEVGYKMKAAWNEALVAYDLNELPEFKESNDNVITPKGSE